MEISNLHSFCIMSGSAHLRADYRWRVLCEMVSCFVFLFCFGRAYYVAQYEPPASASSMLELQPCTVTGHFLLDIDVIKLMLLFGFYCYALGSGVRGRLL